MSIVTASIRVLDLFSYSKNGLSALASFPGPLCRSSTTAIDQVSYADGDRVNRDIVEMAELGPGDFPAKVTLLDGLDAVPTHAQVMGYDLNDLNGDVPEEVKDMPFELPDEAPVLIGKSDLDLPDHTPDPALNALDG